MHLENAINNTIEKVGQEEILALQKEFYVEILTMLYAMGVHPVKDKDIFMDTKVEKQPPKEEGSRVRVAGMPGKWLLRA